MMTAKQDQTLKLLPYLIFVIGLYYFSQDYYALYAFPLDDAWIHRVYAQSFAFGQGFEYNFGVQETGSTSPLWVILTSPTEWLEYEDVSYVTCAVKIIGCLITLLILHFLYKITYLLTENKFTPIIAASLFAADPRLIFSAMSGMEPTLLLFILIFCIWAILKDYYFLAIILLGLAPVTRPEAIVLVPLILLAILLKANAVSKTKRIQLVRSAATWLLPILPFMVWLIYCFVVTGHWLPNTFYIKSAPFNLQFKELLIAYQGLTISGLTATLLLWPGIIGASMLCFKNTRKYPPVILLLLFLVVPITFALAVVGSRVVILDGYYWTRWLDPYTLLITAFVCIGIAVLLSGCKTFLSTKLQESNTYSKSRLFRFLPVVPIALLILSIPRFLYAFNESAFHLTNDARAISLINVETGIWIKENTPENAVVGVNKAGAVRYFGRRKTIDLLGLNNHELASKEISTAQLIAQSDWLVVFEEWSTRQNNLRSFVLKEEFSIAPEEYTICHCPTQTKQIILKRETSDFLPTPTF